MLDLGTNITCNRDDLLISFFTIEDYFVYCNNIQGLLSEMDLPEYNPDEWRLFIDSYKLSLKCLLLHNSNKFACVSIGDFVIIEDHYLNVKMVLQKQRYSKHNKAICVDFKMVNSLLGQLEGTPNILVFSVTGTVALLISTK